MQRALALLWLLACVGCRSGPWYREYGLSSEEEVRQPSAAPKLVRALQSGDVDTVRAASEALRRIGAPAVPALVAELRGGSQVAAWALGELGPQASAAVPALAAALGAPSHHLREAAVRALGQIGAPAADAVPALVQVLRADAKDDVRREVPPALVAIGEATPEVLDALGATARGDRHFRVRRAAQSAEESLRLAALARPRRRPPPPPPPPGRPVTTPIVAVFEIEDAGRVLRAEELDQLSEVLAVELTAVARFKVVPRAQLRARLVEEKTRSYKPCFDDRCQIELGRALAAQKSLATRLLRLGDRCRLTALLYDLRTETTERAASVEAGCDAGRLATALRELATRLAQR